MARCKVKSLNSNTTPEFVGQWFTSERSLRMILKLLPDALRWQLPVGWMLSAWLIRSWCHSWISYRRPFSLLYSCPSRRRKFHRTGTGQPSSNSLPNFSYLPLKNLTRWSVGVVKMVVVSDLLERRSIGAQLISQEKVGNLWQPKERLLKAKGSFRTRLAVNNLGWSFLTISRCALVLPSNLVNPIACLHAEIMILQPIKYEIKWAYQIFHL